MAKNGYGMEALKKLFEEYTGRHAESVEELNSSGRLSFDGTESDDAIVVAAYDAQPEEEFNQFQEDDLFELINFSTTLPQLQYFRSIFTKIF